MEINGYDSRLLRTALESLALILALFKCRQLRHQSDKKAMLYKDSLLSKTNPGKFASKKRKVRALLLWSQTYILQPFAQFPPRLKLTSLVAHPRLGKQGVYSYSKNALKAVYKGAHSQRRCKRCLREWNYGENERLDRAREAVAVDMESQEKLETAITTSDVSAFKTIPCKLKSAQENK